MKRALVWCLLLSLVFCTVASSAGPVALKRKFVETYKDRATIDINIQLDHVKESVNGISKGGKDGDLHMAGRSCEVGLPMVAEIVNAKLENRARHLAVSAESTGRAVSISGAWRLWFEHPAKALQIQGSKVPRATTSNPAHVFEIHPISRIGDHCLLSSFQTIPKYQAYDAEKAFPYYDTLKVRLRATKKEITLQVPRSVYNYTEFNLEVLKKQSVNDGTIVLAKVVDDEDNPLTMSPHRMIFVKGTEPDLQLTRAQKGSQLRVLGIPRIDLAKIYELALKSGTAEVTAKLPYEMIIVGIYPDSRLSLGRKETTRRERSATRP